MSIITYPLNGVVYSAEDVATYLCTRTSGVYSKETNFAVSITGTRQITVAPGLAWINYDDFKGVSVCSREENVLTVPEADNILNRVDRVVLQFDTSENITAIKLKIGTPAVAAQPPDILQNHNQYELGLCTISVPAGSTAVTVADIYDTRADETVCGVMRDGVTGIPAATLIKKLRDEIDKVDSGSFYDKTETDALLNALRNQVNKKISSAISSATSITASGDGYIRFADGTQICWLKFNGWSRKGYDNYFPFPVPFANTNYGAGFALGESITYSVNVECYVFDRATTGLCVYRINKGSIVVIGRWK
jgi:hypothetical protein